MRRLLGVLCLFVGHHVREWVPFVRGAYRGAYGLCRWCECVEAREGYEHVASA